MGFNKIESGYIEKFGQSEKNYIFTYDGELLVLVPKDKSDNPIIDFFRNKEENFDILEGITTLGKKIFFLNCQFKKNNSGFISKPTGFVIFDNNHEEFESITFYGEVIDFFYNPNKIVDFIETAYDYENGGGVLHLKPFEDITLVKKVKISQWYTDLVLSVMLPPEPSYMMKNYNFEKPRSFLRLDFDQKLNASNFQTIYKCVHNLMSFLDFRKNIIFDEATLGIKEEGKIAKIGYFYPAFNSKFKDERMDINRTIGYYFVIDKINELIQIVNEKSLNLLFLPEDIKSTSYLTPEYYMICCTSFESVFKFVFPNAREEYLKIANEVKQELLNFISQKNEEYKGKDKKRRQEYKKYSDMIHNLDFGLAEKLKKCITENKSMVEIYINRTKTRLSIVREIDTDSLCEIFAKKRNEFMHSHLSEFTHEHIVAYMLVRVLIYIMILKKAEIDENKIMHIISDLTW